MQAHALILFILSGGSEGQRLQSSASRADSSPPMDYLVPAAAGCLGPAIEYLDSWNNSFGELFIIILLNI